MTPLLSIELPIPPPEVRPNSRSHFRIKAERTRQFRDTARMEAMAAAYKWDLKEPVKHPAIGIQYWHPTRRHIDADNILASLKAAIDGVTDAGIWTDDSECLYLPVRRETDPQRPRVELLVFDAERYSYLFEWWR